MVELPPEAHERISFEDLYRRWFPSVVRACHRHLGSGHDAEAVAQEALVRAWRSWEHYAHDRPFGPWVSAIARRLCTSEIRRAARREHLLRGRSSALPALQEDAWDVAVRSTGVDIALRRLSSRAQRLLVLRDVEGRPYEEIAQAEGVSPLAIRLATRRARAAFRVAYEQAVGPPAVLAATRPSWWQRVRRLLEAVPERVPSLEPVVAGAVLLLAPVVPVVTDAPVAGPADPAVAIPISAPVVGQAGVPPVETDSMRDLGGPVDELRATVGVTADAIDPIVEGGYYNFAVSPNYAEDRTVFAIGRSTPCTGGACLVFLRSTDGGENWSRRRAAGVFATERPSVLLPPSYPQDRRIFVHAGGGDAWLSVLAVSHDDGDTFAPLTSSVFPMDSLVPSMSPRFSAGDPRILVGATTYQPALVYRDDTKRVEPLRLPLLSGAQPSDFVFGHDDDSIVMSALVPPSRAVLRCTPAACSTVLTSPVFTPLYLVAGGDQSPGSVLAWTPTTLYRSHDDGRSFEPVPSPGADDGGRLVEVVPDRAGHLLALVQPQSEPRRRLFESNDLGTTWTRLSVPDSASIHRLVVLPDGVLLASLFGDDDPLACSVDGGRTWASRCRRAA